MEKLLINGGNPLEGEVRISGAKNSVLPILAASLLCEDNLVIGNVPHLQDVTTTISLLTEMGANLSIDERMNKINIDSEKNTFGLTEDSNRYANAVSRNIDTDLLGDVIIAAKNTEKVQESDRRRRENNAIIYGVDEREDTSDEEYIKQLFNVIGFP